MKHEFDRNAFRLTDAERQTLWQRIRRPDAAERPAPKRRLVPALAATAAALAVVALVVSTSLDRRGPGPAATIELHRLAAPSAGTIGLGTGGVKQTDALSPTAAPAATPRRLTVAPGPESRRAPAVPPPVADASAPRQGPPAMAPLEPVVVEGDTYMSEVRSGTAEQKITSERLTKYAIDSVEDAIARQAGAARGGSAPAPAGGASRDRGRAAPGAVAPAAERFAEAARVRRDDEVARARHEDDDYARDFRARCWIPPREPSFDMMYFRHTGINPFVRTEADALSTFALDVDNASYTLLRSYLDKGQLPPPAAVRVEECVNYFAQDYPPVDRGDFGLYADGAPSPFGDGYHLLRIGVRARDVRDADRRPASLVLVIDVSGSMARENRLELVKRALRVLLDRLDRRDTVGIVAYTTTARVVLDPLPASERGTIEAALDELRPEQSTNVDEGLELGYLMARTSFRPGTLNRIVLCTDGVANESRTDPAAILAHVRREADAGIHLTAIGVGMGNYNDALLEQLADKSDGNYYYVDTMDEARRVFGEKLTGTLQTVAKDAKIQVEFDPARVSRWRLIGYEKRALADRDFRNDDVDAGEVGAGHQVTALYAVKLVDDPASDPLARRDRARGDRLGVVRLRWREPESEGRQAGLARELERRITLDDLSPRFSRAPARLRLDAAVAAFAEILRGSYWLRGVDLAEVARLADEVSRDLADDADAQEFARLAGLAARLRGPESDDSPR